MLLPMGKRQRQQNTSSVKQIFKIASMVHILCCTTHLGGHCIYSTYAVPPVAEGLMLRFPEELTYGFLKFSKLSIVVAKKY